MNIKEFAELKKQALNRYETDIAAIVRVWSLCHPNENPPEIDVPPVVEDEPEASNEPRGPVREPTAEAVEPPSPREIATAMDKVFDAISGTFSWKELMAAATSLGVKLKKSTISQFLRRKVAIGRAKVYRQGLGRRATTFKKISVEPQQH